MGNYLKSPRLELTTDIGGNATLDYAASESQGWRITMEDAKIAAIDGNQAFFAVFDGHGGHEVASFAKAHFLSILRANRHYRHHKYEEALQHTFLELDEALQKPEGQKELVRLQRRLPAHYKINVLKSDSKAGSTAVVALLKDNTLYVANAGDSRCIVAEKGKAVAMSTDHKPDLPEEMTRIQNAGGTVSNGRVMGKINLSRAIGDFSYKKDPDLPPQQQMITAFPEVRRHAITPDTDFVVLACDGIWDVISNQDCADLVYQGIRNGKSLSTVAGELMDKCRAPQLRNYGVLGRDNMTCIIVRLKNK